VTLAARASRLTPVVHAVDDGGALCGAAPRPRWRRSDRLPVNCPRCLRALASERWALCGVPGASGDNTLHIRRVGPEGLRKGGRSVNQQTLCGLAAGWDVAELEPAHLADRRLHDACRRAYTVARH
jgi:hypothetical protein